MKPSIRGFLAWAMARAIERPGLAFAGLAGIIVQVACSLAMPLTMEYLIDDVIPTQDYGALAVAVGIVAAATLSYFLGGLTVDYTTSRLAAAIVGDVRLTMFRRVQTAPASFFATHSEGEIVTRFGTDAITIETTIIRALPVAIRRFLKIICAGVILFSMEWRVALLVFAALPFTILLSRPFGKRGTAADIERKDGEGEVTKLVQESFASHMVVRAFELEAHLADRFGAALEHVRATSARSNMLYATTGSVSSLGIAVLELAVMGTGALVVVGGGMTVGLLVAFLGLFRNVSAAARGLTEMMPTLLNGATSLARTSDLLALVPPGVDEGGTKPLGPLANAIRFERVDFAYATSNASGSSPLTLAGVELELPAKRRVAFVGRSGSGKSTTLSLLMRLQAPTAGRITYDGVDLDEARPSSLRAQTAVVLQDTGLFDATIRENIRCGRLDADTEAIERAAKRARIHDVIESFEDGYDTIVGARGARLSGGQRQRVAIARALVRDPSLLLLDEATSALDPAAEAEVNDTIRDACDGQTVVAVTHRLNSVVDYDLIVVFDGGRVVERGTHQELLESGGVYADLWQKQSGFVVKPDGSDARVSAERLELIPFLASAPLEALQILADDLRTARFAAGEVVFEAGDPGDRFFLIARGRLEAYLGEGDEARILSVMEDGDFFGEIALVEAGVRTASVRAVTDSLCLTLTRAKFERLLAEHPALSREVLQTAQRRLANG
ncbi:MAG: ABC transporter transmembrane domain-containing protein [Deltaproteobacteria bacterium]|jgi:ATP-binding cassette subfamily B protein